MFRLLLRSVFINIAGLYLSVVILSGVVAYTGDIKSLFFGSLLIIVINLFIRPVINLLLLPLHLVTLGLFRWIANIAVFYCITMFVSGFTVHPFTSSPLDLPFIIIPSFSFSAFGAFIYATVVFTLIFQVLYWLFQD